MCYRLQCRSFHSVISDVIFKFESVKRSDNSNTRTPCSPGNGNLIIPIVGRFPIYIRVMFFHCACAHNIAEMYYLCINLYIYMCMYYTNKCSPGKY